MKKKKAKVSICQGVIVRFPSGRIKKVTRKGGRTHVRLKGGVILLIEETPEEFWAMVERQE